MKTYSCRLCMCRFQSENDSLRKENQFCSSECKRINAIPQSRDFLDRFFDKHNPSYFRLPTQSKTRFLDMTPWGMGSKQYTPRVSRRNLRLKGKGGKIRVTSKKK
jgi:hypothetical protein